MGTRRPGYVTAELGQNQRDHDRQDALGQIVVAGSLFQRRQQVVPGRGDVQGRPTRRYDQVAGGDDQQAAQHHATRPCAAERQCHGDGEPEQRDGRPREGGPVARCRERQTQQQTVQTHRAQVHRHQADARVVGGEQGERLGRLDARRVEARAQAGHHDPEEEHQQRDSCQDRARARGAQRRGSEEDGDDREHHGHGCAGAEAPPRETRRDGDRAEAQRPAQAARRGGARSVDGRHRRRGDRRGHALSRGARQGARGARRASAALRHCRLLLGELAAQRAQPSLDD